MIILHGLFGSSDNWQSLGRRFAENYEVFMVDQRNHGRSPHSAEFSYQLMVDDLFELIQTEMLSDIVLIGHSMGGKTAMNFAQQHPQYLNKLVVVDMGIQEYSPHHQDVLAGMNAVDFQLMKTRSEVDRIISKYVSQKGVKQFLMKNLHWREKGQLAWRFNLPVLVEKMGELLIEVPFEVVDVHTLFIRGGNSDYITDDSIFDIKQVFPRSEICTIEGAGHWVHSEAPSEFFDAVADFV